MGLFNGFIPLIALQMSALKFGDQISLVFTKVVDAFALGMPDEEVQSIADRAHWEARATRETVAMADEMLSLIRTFAPSAELKFTKFYISVAKDGHNFATFRPKRNSFQADIRLKPSPDIDQQIEKAGIDTMGYDNRWGAYRLTLFGQDIKKHSELLLKLLKMSYGVDIYAGLAMQAAP